MSGTDHRHIMSENERKKILDDIHVGIWRIEETPGEPERMFGDEKMYAILGAAPETEPEELYRHWHSRIEPLYRAYVDNAVNRLITTGEPTEVEYIWNHPQRGRTVVRCDATLSSPRESGKIGMLGMHRDITDKLISRNWEDENHHIVDHYKMSLCGRYLFRTYEDIFFVDRTAGTLHPVAYGRGPALTIEDSWEIRTVIDKCVPPADQEKVDSLFSQESMEKIAAGSSAVGADFRRLNIQGSYDWVRGSLYPVPINGMDELMFVVQDIGNEQQLKALRAEKEDVLHSIIHPRAAIYEWNTGSDRLQVLKHDLQRLPRASEGEGVPLPEFVKKLCEHYVDASEQAKARAFLTRENMGRCAAERRKRSVILLLDAENHRYNWIRVSMLPSSLSGTKVYLVLEMMDRKEGLYPILESYVREMTDHCYCIDLKTDYFFRFVGDEESYGTPPEEGNCYTQEMERYVDRYVVEEEREKTKERMRPEYILRMLETKPEYSFEETVIAGRGETRKKRLTFTPLHQSKGYVLLQRIDITELSRKDKMLETAQRLSVTDPLTQLYNRRGGEREIREALKETRKNAVMIMLDLNHFKEVNDRLGHPMGDWVLQEAARKLRECFRTGDIIFRLGGDEFVVFLKSMAHREDISPVLDRLVTKMRLVCEKDGHTVTVTASVGAAFYSGQSYEELYRQADTALYRAKGKTGYSLFGENE